MSNKFIPFQTVITADWLNTIDQTVYEALQRATTAEEARLALSAVEEAPSDGVSYSRADRQWVATGAGSTNINTRGYDLTDFPGATWDTRFEYALANLESGNRIIIPADNGTPLVFDGAHTLNNDDGRWLQVTGNRTQIITTNIAPWLTVKTVAGPHPIRPRTLIKGLRLSAQNLYQGTGIKLIDVGFINIFECAFDRFENAIHLYNDNYWTEYCVIEHCNFRANRVGIYGSCKLTNMRSQRAIKVLDCLITTGNLVAGEVDDSEWNYCLKAEDISWYHSSFLGVGLGIKRNYSCGVKLVGASFIGSYGFLEGEADYTFVDNVRGIWLTNGIITPDLPATALGAHNLVFAMGAISDGVKPNQHVIYDERTNVGAQKQLDFKVVAWPGYFQANKPIDRCAATNLIAGPNQFGTATVSNVVGSTYTTDGDFVFAEKFDQLAGGTLANWTEWYKVKEKSLRTKAFTTEVALALGCMPFNPNTYTATSLLVDGSTNYIDISEANCNIIRLGGTIQANAIIHEIRGGRLGQIIAIKTLLPTGGPILAHKTTAGAVNGHFQIEGLRDYKFPAFLNTVFTIYAYHASVGEHWSVINNLQTRSLFLSAERWFPSITNGCGALSTMEAAFAALNFRFLPFEATTSKSAHIDFTLPRDYLGGPLTCQIFCGTNDAAMGIVTWELAGRAYIPPGDLTVALGTPVQLVMEKTTANAYRSITSNRVDLTLAGTPTAGNQCHLKIARVAGGMAASIGLLGVEITYQSIG